MHISALPNGEHLLNSNIIMKWMMWMRHLVLFSCIILHEFIYLLYSAYDLHHKKADKN